jgi:hypothetical protein
MNTPFIAEAVKGYQSEFAPRGGVSRSLDAPVREDMEDSAALKDFEPAPEADSNPHQQLEAKQAVTARLNGAASAAFVVPAVEGAREADRANGHNPQQDKVESLSLDVPVRGMDGEDGKQTYANVLESAVPNLGQELMAKKAGGGDD